jgi:hypothetical protein
MSFVVQRAAVLQIINAQDGHLVCFGRAEKNSTSKLLNSVWNGRSIQSFFVQLLGERVR